MDKQRNVLFGPPGTGKTTHLVGLMAKHSESSRKHQIGLATFTKQAARELSERAGLGKSEHCSTIHSMAMRLTGLVADQIMGPVELRAFIRASGIEMTVSANFSADSGEGLKEGDYYMEAYQLARANLIDPIEQYRSNPPGGTFEGYKRWLMWWDKYKKANGLVDFNDILDMALDMPRPRYDVFFVDEAQDLSPQQWRLINYWIEEIPVVYIAGDDDQSIYRWGGADPLGMQKFVEEHGAKMKILDQSYRVPRQPWRLANKLIANITERVPKKYKPMDHDGIVRHHDTYGMLEVKHGESCYILVRNHSQRPDIERWLQNNGIPYFTRSGKAGPLQSAVVRAYRAYMKAVNGEELDYKEGRFLERKLNPFHKQMVAKHGISILKQYQWHQAIRMTHERDYLLRLYRQYGTIEIEATVELTTMHSVKGGQRDRVILLNSMTQRTLQSYYKDKDSEIRTFYVGLTRVADRLDIVHGTNPLPELVNLR